MDKVNESEELLIQARACKVDLKALLEKIDKEMERIKIIKQLWKLKEW